MKKLLRVKDVLLLTAAGLLDVSSELRDPFGMVAAGYKDLYGWVPGKYRPSNFSRTVEKSLTVGELERVVKNGEVYLRITSSGKEKVMRDFPLLALQNQRWDGRWRVVVFDIIEVARATRDKLRRKLKNLGFGQFQKSVWITPHEITVDFMEFIQTKSLSDTVSIFECKKIGGEESSRLAERIWKLTDLNEKYRKLLNKMHDRVSSEAEGKQTRMEYLALLSSDPFLPRELLPEDWYREKLARVLRRL